MRAIVGAAIVYAALFRVFELWLSRRHLAAVRASGGGRVTPDATAPLVAVHVSWFIAMIGEELWLGPAALPELLRAASWIVFAAAELLRVWCIRTLGERWNVHVVVLPGAERIARGPYRWLPHPNYAAAAVGVVALPLALALPWTAALVLPFKLLALRRRIALEERALRGVEYGA